MFKKNPSKRRKGASGAYECQSRAISIETGVCKTRLIIRHVQSSAIQAPPTLPLRIMFGGDEDRVSAIPESIRQLSDSSPVLNNIDR